MCQKQFCRALGIENNWTKLSKKYVKILKKKCHYLEAI